MALGQWGHLLVDALMVVLVVVVVVVVVVLVLVVLDVVARCCARYHVAHLGMHRRKQTRPESVLRSNIPLLAICCLSRSLSHPLVAVALAFGTWEQRRFVL